jgi:nucleoside-diphosphate-sugar epimerase
MTSDFSEKRVLVTGGRGFIGAAVCGKLRDAGADVWTVARSEPEDDDPQALVGDLQSIDATRQVIAEARPDIILHLASHVIGMRSPDVVLSTYHSNLTSTVNLLVAAQESGCDRVVLTGSLEEPDPSTEWPVPSSPYTAAKLAAGAYGRMCSALFDMSVVILRVFMVYGPGQQDDKKLIPYVITSLLDGNIPEFTSGQREVDWIFVDDVAEAYLRAAITPGVEGLTLDVGSGQTATVREVVERLFELMQACVPPQFGSVADRPMEQIRRANVEAIEKAIGWAPRTSLDEGLQATIDWYRHRR